MDPYEALQHAVKAHGADLDKGGLLYVLHPIAVANFIEHGPDLPWWDEATLPYEAWRERRTAIVVALLHDVLEDTDHELDRDDFTDEQWEALVLVTHDPADTYAEYIEKIAGEPFACVVKLADLAHNLSPARQAALPTGEARGLEGRYLKARQRLWDALGVEWWPA